MCVWLFLAELWMDITTQLNPLSPPPPSMLMNVSKNVIFEVHKNCMYHAKYSVCIVHSNQSEHYTMM